MQVVSVSYLVRRAPLPGMWIPLLIQKILQEQGLDSCLSGSLKEHKYETREKASEPSSLLAIESRIVKLLFETPSVWNPQFNLPALQGNYDI